jgi:hypothetical protein
MRPLRLGTRASALAMTQSGLVADALRALGIGVDLVTIRTLGDQRPPDTTWGEGAFVGALETALLAGDVDLVSPSRPTHPARIRATRWSAARRDSPSTTSRPAAGSEPTAPAARPSSGSADPISSSTRSTVTSTRGFAGSTTARPTASSSRSPA